MVNSPYMAFSPYVCHNNKENLVFHAYIQSVTAIIKEDFIIMTDKTQNRQFRIRQWADAIKDQQSSGLTVDQWSAAHEVTRYQFYYRQRVVRKELASCPDFPAQDNPEMANRRDDPAACGVEREPQAAFAELPAAVFPSSVIPAAPEPAAAGEAVPVLRLRSGRSILEVSNDASERILGFLREMVMHEG